MHYRDLPEAEQIEALRPVAVAATDRFGLDVVRLELVAHEFNTTFAVDTAGGARYALRVHTNSVSTPANVAAQQSWQRAIAADTDVLVPAPLTTSDGEWYAEVESDAFGRPLLVTAASWLPGDDVAETDAAVAQELGRTMALLHQHAEHWSLPPGTAMQRFDTPMFGDEDLLSPAPGMSAGQRDVLDRARQQTDRSFARVYDGASVRPLHADLHGGNLKWDGHRLAVFDFDDCGLGLPVLDLAIAAFYLRGGDPAPEQALRAGYAEVAPVPEIGRADFEALVAARQLLLANSLLTITTAELRSEAERYLVVTVERLRHWLETGVFTRALT